MDFTLVHKMTYIRISISNLKWITMGGYVFIECYFVFCQDIARTKMEIVRCDILCASKYKTSKQETMKTKNEDK